MKFMLLEVVTDEIVDEDYNPTVNQCTFFGPFDSLGETDDWAEKFGKTGAMYSTEVIYMEPIEFTEWKDTISIRLLVDYGIKPEDQVKLSPGFDFLGHWQAGIAAEAVADVWMGENK